MGILKNIWDKSKDGKQVEQRTFLRFVIITTVVFVGFLLLNKDSLTRWIQTGFTISAQKKQIEMLKRENEELERRILDMRTNKDTLEKYAREEFFFSAPGEDVYIIEK